MIVRAMVRDGDGPEYDADVELDAEGWPAVVRVDGREIRSPRTADRRFRFDRVPDQRPPSLPLFQEEP